jgi:hypothetical protein
MRNPFIKKHSEWDESVRVPEMVAIFVVLLFVGYNVAVAFGGPPTAQLGNAQMSLLMLRLLLLLLIGVGIVLVVYGLIKGRIGLVAVGAVLAIVSLIVFVLLLPVTIQ